MLLEDKSEQLNPALRCDTGNAERISIPKHIADLDHITHPERLCQAYGELQAYNYLD